MNLARSSLAALLLLSVSELTPLALASPPDPIWVGGIFDAADLDDVVVAVMLTEGVTDGAAFETAKAVWLVLGAVPLPSSLDVARCVASSLHGRSPPAV